MELNNQTIETAGNTFEQLSHTGQSGVILAGIIFFVVLFILVLYVLYKIALRSHNSNVTRIEALEKDKHQCREQLDLAIGKIDETHGKLEECYNNLVALKPIH